MHEVPVRMPKMSMTMTEGEVVSWAVEPGAQVQAGDTVCEVLTDKVDMEVESPVSGRIVRITVETGMADVGAPIAWVETEDEDPLAGLFDEPGGDGPAAEAPAPEPAAEAAEGAAPDPALSSAPTAAPADPSEPPAAAPPAPPPGASPVAPTAAGPVPAVPRARAMARDAGLDLARLDGSGPEGRVLVADVERYLADAAAPQAPTLAATPAAGAAPSRGAAARDRRAEAIRAAIARTMTASAAVPQFTVWRDLELEPADAARGRISWTTLLLRAYAGALRQVPTLLGRWDGERAVPVEEVGVGLAVETPDGLLVPVFADPDLVAVDELDSDVRAAVSNARGGRVTADHLLPAVASLSNLGGLGVDRFQALVTPPQSSVLAVGAVTRRPVAIATGTGPGGIGLGLRVTAGLSVDHRVGDGAHGARLLGEVAAALAEPIRLVGPVGARVGAGAR